MIPGKHLDGQENYFLQSRRWGKWAESCILISNMAYFFLLIFLICHFEWTQLQLFYWTKIKTKFSIFWNKNIPLNNELQSHTIFHTSLFGNRHKLSSLSIQITSPCWLRSSLQVKLNWFYNSTKLLSKQ